MACAFLLICLTGGLSALLTGCGIVETAQETAKKLVPETEPVFEETTLWVKEDGTWTEILKEKLEQDYYDTTELKNMVDETVGTFNASEGEGSVTVDEYTIDTSGITLTMTYRDAETYGEFNQMPAFQGSMLQAQMAGYSFLNDFREMNADGTSSDETIGNEVPLSHKECRVLITDPSHIVKIPEKVKYVSANGAVTDWKIIRPVGSNEDEEPAGLVLPSSAVYVAEKSRTQASLEDREKGYLYIIYD